MQLNTVKRALTSAAIVGLVGTMGLGALPASAEYPNKPIRMIVGLAAGGGTDSLARSIASFIHEEVGMPGVVINKTGAASMVQPAWCNTCEANLRQILIRTSESLALLER
jgi:tripartite-type tricarboxylate transporter receptor subunit TctC